MGTTGPESIEHVTTGPPERVLRPLMLQHWSAVAFLHWHVDVETIRPLIDPELEADTFDGRAWIGLVPFRMTMRPPMGPTIPGLSTFPETNVRTYVRGPDGARGLSFLSLDVPRSAAVVAARLAFGLPYFWSAMTLEEAGRVVTYRARRRLPSRGATSVVKVRIGPAIPRTRVDELTDFLTARFRLFGRGPMGLYVLPVEHPPWGLHSGTAISVADELVTAAGLPQPIDPPLVHVSPGVEVRVGMPRSLPGEAR
jgi:uncharacterized protein YqjF (DUF2071 family)